MSSIIRRSRRVLQAGKSLSRPAVLTPRRCFTDLKTQLQDDGAKQPLPKKSEGSYIRILAVLALSGTIGYGVRALTDNDRSSKQIAEPSEFVQYRIASKETVSPTCSIFTLRPASGTMINTAHVFDQQAITSVQFKQPQLQIARHYTNLPAFPGQPEDELRFLIRREQNGEVSGYLHRLPIDGAIELRGPSVDYVLPDNVEEVLFLAGGTGIAPAMQIADKLAGRAKVHVLWANRRREDCVGGVSDTAAKAAGQGWTSWLCWSSTKNASDRGEPSADLVPGNAVVRQLQSLKQGMFTSPDHRRELLVDYFVDEEGTRITPAHISRLLAAAQTGDGKRLVIVSGPEGFISYFAGPKEWADGREVQGRVGGILETLDRGSWEVVKL